MKSTRKGSQYEKEAKTILEHEGYLVEGQHRRVMFIRPPGQPPRMVMVGRDIFGCDLIAKRLGEKTLWVQVSTVDNFSKKVKQVLAYPWSEHEVLQIWGRVRGKREFRVREWAAGPQAFFELDERKCLNAPCPKA